MDPASEDHRVGTVLSGQDSFGSPDRIGGRE